MNDGNYNVNYNSYSLSTTVYVYTISILFICSQKKIFFFSYFFVISKQREKRKLHLNSALHYIGCVKKVKIIIKIFSKNAKFISSNI